MNIKSIVVLGFCTLLLFGVLYPLAMVGVGQLMPERANGLPVYRGEMLVGYENVGQAFHSPKYFWGRPSAVDYDASSTGGSNLSPTNPEYLDMVKARMDSLMKYHPGLNKEDIPVDLVTASGSGLDPNISVEAARIQAERVAEVRGVSPETVNQLIDAHIEKPLLGLFGPGDYINVLKINLALDEM
ncbi:potassium-transporting ATPase subunit KdpC [Catalinimonas sp. 4WD22]|uniref:potassium-transporting ATPase subunit KdpC n=1 Tax=Catalinimonas locisalis TaxID=3133978 RepID=UPI0031012CA0